MKKGDTVLHRKTGRTGVVKEVNWHGTGNVRVAFDSRQSVMSPRTLEVVGAGAVAMSEREEEIERQRAVVKRSSQVPYGEIERAVAHFRERFPDAADIKPIYYASHVYCEIWKPDRSHAKVLLYEGG